jgi:hypothetical protein
MGVALVVSNSGDIHCDFLADACSRLKIDFFRLNTDHFRKSGNLSWRVCEGDGRLEIDNRSCRLLDVGVLIYRRPVPVHQLRRDIEPWVGRLLDAEWTALEGALSQSVTCKVVNGMAGSALAQNKIVQLQVASRCGLAVPETLVTTDVDKLREFADTYRCITKGIVNAFHIDKQNLRSAFTSFVDRSSLEAYDPAGMPTLLQRALESAAIWRVVHVSGQHFGFRFHGPKLAVEPDSRTIERDLDGATLPVPDAVVSGMSRMCSSLGIEFASADFVEDAAGKMWFLDLNPEGQWAYLEDRFGVRISDSLVSLANS